MTSLYLFRHGETEENARHVLQGLMPGHLSELGIRQTKDAADTVRALDVDVVLCSDIKRCVDTYDILSLEITGLPEINTTKLLRERDWGSATGTVADGFTKIEMPDDAETMKTVKARARIFLEFVGKTYSGKKVLAISHGLFLRVLQSVVADKELRDIEPMKNAEVRLLTI